MIVAAVRETFPGERRVALAPASVPKLIKAGCEVFVEREAGLAAGFRDADYRDAGAKIVGTRDEAFHADVVFAVRALGANPHGAPQDLALLHPKVTMLAMCDPLGAPQAIADAARTGANLFALEMLPRITRAQSMDVLSSMATIAGYRAVLLAAMELPKLFPMLTTAAGTLSAAKVFILGVGVAGLQAIATARRLGGVVQAYDVRPATREQVESLGAKFVELPLAADGAQDQGGYAKALGEEFYRRQRELLADVAAGCDVVITTAAVPGKRSPLLVTRDAVERMAPGSVVIDLAAERGGNCEVTQADERVVHEGVTVLGPTNLPSDAPRDASRMLSNNYTTLLLHLLKDGQLALSPEDEIVRDTMVAHGGAVTNDRIAALLAPPAPPEPAPPEPAPPPPSPPTQAGENLAAE